MNWTAISRVTCEDTYHYTVDEETDIVAELIFNNCFLMIGKTFIVVRFPLTGNRTPVYGVSVRNTFHNTNANMVDVILIMHISIGKTSSVIKISLSGTWNPVFRIPRGHSNRYPNEIILNNILLKVTHVTNVCPASPKNRTIRHDKILNRSLNIIR